MNQVHTDQWETQVSFRHQLLMN